VAILGLRGDTPPLDGKLAKRCCALQQAHAREVERHPVLAVGGERQVPRQATAAVLAQRSGLLVKPSASQPHSDPSPMPTRTSPDLSLPLSEPINLARGPRSHLVTLMDAAILIRDLEPFRQARPVWDRAAEMILIAAETGAANDVVEATRQLLVALDHENWWKPARTKELIE